jgi:hypothetical protein
MITSSRREFLATSAAAVLAAPMRLGAAGMEATPPAPWFDRPMRWAQLTLVEDDPGRYDPAFWLDYFQRVHADAVCLSAGGCVAYYPTKIPFHHRSAWMKDNDPFGELVAGCRKMGLIVVARTDPHATYQDVHDAHPEWIAVDAAWNRRRHWASPEMWVTCALGPYNFEFMTEVTKEIVSLYKVDGVFSNRWSGSGMCYCEHCRRNFAADSGLELPRTNDPADPRRRAYILWRQKRLLELWRLWDAEIRKINPGAWYIPNTGGGALSDLDMKEIGALAPTLMADRQARRGVMPPWANGKNAKEYRAALGRKPVVGIFSVGMEEPYRWKDSVQGDAEIKIWVIDGIANGIRPWFTKFSGTLHDRRWLKPVEEVYSWHYRNERYLRNIEPLARIGLVYSQQTAWFYGGEHSGPKVEDHTLGFYQALVEARIPFEMVHDRLLDPGSLKNLRVLVLPNIAALSDVQCAQLREFVRAGGGLVATFETSLYDEWGVRRKDFGLGELFGAHYAGENEGPMRNSYLRLERGSGADRIHPLLAGMEGMERIINGVNRVKVEPGAGFPLPPLTLVPSYPDLPMEKVYPRQPRTDIPGVFAHESGKGRVVYFPWDIDRTFWEILAAEHGLLLRNAVDWAAAEQRPVEVEGPGLFDVTIWRQESSITVHLVNLTNPLAMKGPYREFIPVGPIRVKFRLPAGTRPRKVQLLVSGTAARSRVENGQVDLTIPSITSHEVVAVDL